MIKFAHNFMQKLLSYYAIMEIKNHNDDNLITK